MRAIQQLAIELPCPLVIYNTEVEQELLEGIETDTLGEPLSFVIRTQMRLLNGFVRVASPAILSRISRIPLTNSEVMERVRYRYELDEIKTFRLLAGAESVSCTLFLEWKLTRGIIKNAMQSLSYNRRLQVTLASILTGTRFKYYDTLMGGGSTRLPTVCQLCGKRDSPAHILHHAGVTELPSCPDEQVTFLALLAKTAEVINPHISAPLVTDVATEIELELFQDDGASLTSADTLSFDRDV